MLHVEMLPAGNGDALWVEYGSSDAPYRILIDGGVQGTGKLLRERTAGLPDGDRRFDLIVLTHVDADHIAGLLAVLEATDLDFGVCDFWMNGWKHVAPDQLGAEQGERLTRLVQRRELPWNEAFHGRAVVVPEIGDLPTATLPGGLRLTVLSPSQEQLWALAPEWERAIQKLGPPDEVVTEAVEEPDLLGGRPNPDRLAKARFYEDGAIPNGTSIGLLLEYQRRTVLLGADAHPSRLAVSIENLLEARGLRRLELDAYKVSHHGSAGNTSPRLLDLISCPTYLFSTNGVQHGHPDQEAVAGSSAEIEGLPRNSCSTTEAS